MTQFRVILALLLTASALAALPSCSKSPAEAQQHRGDSPPPQPIGKPQVVKPDPNRTVFNAAIVPGLFKTPTQQLINQTRDRACREWRKDAGVTHLRYQLFQRGSEPVHAWVEVTVNSASDGAQRNYSVGDIYDGQVFDFKISDIAASKKKATVEAIGDIKAGLTEANATLKRLGYDQEYSEADLEFVGKGGKRELRPGASSACAMRQACSLSPSMRSPDGSWTGATPIARPIGATSRSRMPSRSCATRTRTSRRRRPR